MCTSVGRCLCVTPPSAVFLQILPAAAELLPSTVLTFQLLHRPGHGDQAGAVVAWGAFPAWGANLRHIHGRWSDGRHGGAFVGVTSREENKRGFFCLPGSKRRSSEESQTHSWTSFRKLKP